VDKFSVLLVDDEKEFLETLMKRLRKRNLRVTGVGSGEDALKVLKETLLYKLEDAYKRKTIQEQKIKHLEEEKKLEGV